MPLSHFLPSAQLQFGQDLFQDVVAVSVPASWVTRAPLHDLLLQNPLNSSQRETVDVLSLAVGSGWKYKRS